MRGRASVTDARVFGRIVFAAAWMAGLVAKGDRLFVGILEADSYQSAIYGTSAFSRVADLPLVLELVQTALSRAMALPSRDGVSSQGLLRIVQTVDPSQPLGEDNPANVAILPLSGDQGEVVQAFATGYRRRKAQGPSEVFESPANTNLQPRVAVAFCERHVLTSSSPDALEWVWKNRLSLLNAPPQSIPGTFRVLVNPQRVADLLGSRGEAFGVNANKLLSDLETLAFSLTMDGQALAVTLRGRPIAQTGLAAWSAALQTPAERLWDGLPDESFFQSLAACRKPELGDAYFGGRRFRLVRPYTGLIAGDVFSGEALSYLVPTRDRQGLAFVRMEPVRQSPEVVEAIQKLHTVKQEDGVVFSPPTSRPLAGMTVQTYKITLQPLNAAADGEQSGAVVNTLLSLFLKQAVLETAVKDGMLITVLGPPGTFEDELATLAFAEKQVPLSRVIRSQDEALRSPLTCGARLRLTSLLRYMVSIIPGVKPEQVRVLPTGGDGAVFGGAREEDGTLTYSIRFHSNEIAALQRINRDGRAVLQEIFFQMFSKQMMNVQPAKEGALK